MAIGTLRVIQRPSKATIAELLDDQLTEFDALLRDVRGGIRSPAQFDEFEDRANRIGQGLRDAFRANATARVRG